MPKTTPSTAKKNNLTVSVYNRKGVAVGSMTLPEELFQVTVSPALLTQAIRVFQANQRMGTHSAKTRGEVASSTRKIYRQKGTGRARHGAVSAPVFVGGGVAHGPKPRDYSMDFSVAMRRKALFGALSERLDKGCITFVEGLSDLETKTKQMVAVLNNLDTQDGKKKERSKTLLIISDDLTNLYKAGRNIEHLTIRPARLINCFELLTNQKIIVMKESVDVMKKTFIGKPSHASSAAEKTKTELHSKITVAKQEKKSSPSVKKVTTKKLTVKSEVTKSPRKRKSV